MGTAAWRRLLLALCALALIQVGVIVWMTAKVNGALDGIAWVATDPEYVVQSSSKTPFLDGISVAPGSAAYRAGLRTGDLVDLRQLSPADRYRWITTFPRVGERIDLTVIRNGRELHIPVTAQYIAFTWDVWLAYLGFAWSILFAALISWRRADAPEARVLALLLILVTLGDGFQAINWSTPWAGADAIVSVLGIVLAAAGTALFATYAMLFAPRSAVVPRTLAWLTYASALAASAYGIAYVIGVWALWIDPTQSWYSGAFGQTITAVAPQIIPVLCVLATIAQTRGSARARMAWTTLSLGVYYLITAVAGAVVIFAPGFGSRAILAWENIGVIIAPLGLTYALLNRRLLDVNFALNRAAVFSGVSIVVVGLFVLVEWVLSEWFKDASHTTNLAISAALALILGLSIRSIHQRVDRALDTIFFRKRHEDERAILSFAHEAAFITDAQTLLERAKHTLQSHADASFVDFILDDGGNDPAIVALRAWHKTLDLHTVDTQLRGEYAYPMIARGRLVGALVIGPKRSGESYAPDESDAIRRLSDGVGTALELLSSNADNTDNSVIAAIAAMSDRLSDEIRYLGSRLNLSP